MKTEYNKKIEEIDLKSTEDNLRKSDITVLKEEESDSLGSTEDFRGFKEENEAEKFAKEHGLISPTFFNEHLGQMRFKKVEQRQEPENFLFSFKDSLNRKLFGVPILKMLNKAVAESSDVLRALQCERPGLFYRR